MAAWSYLYRVAERTAKRLSVDGHELLLPFLVARGFFIGLLYHRSLCLPLPLHFVNSEQEALLLQLLGFGLSLESFDGAPVLPLVEQPRVVLSFFFVHLEGLLLPIEETEEPIQELLTVAYHTLG